MKVLLAGDSWGIGVYKKTLNDYKPTGQGLQTFIDCDNISYPGISNTEIINNIEKADNSAATIFLQTDILREQSYHGTKGNELYWRCLHDEFIQQLLRYNSIKQYIEEYFSIIYSRLDNLAKKRNQQILCVGGWSDLHPSIVNYKNLTPVIYSCTQTLIAESPCGVYISDFEYFLQFNETLVRDQFNIELKEIALASSKKFDLCCQYWGDVHPTLEAYEVLAKIIQKHLLRHK